VDTASKIIQLDHDDLDAIRLVIRQNLFRTSLDLLHPLWAAPAFRFRDRIVRTRDILAGRDTYTVRRDEPPTRRDTRFRSPVTSTCPFH
jgi:hypothetical protein